MTGLLSTRLRLLVNAALVATALGCMGLTIKDVEGKYGPVQPHWIGHPQRIDGLLELGQVVDPKMTGDQLVPYKYGNPGLIEGKWFTLAHLNRIDVFIVPTIPRSQYWNFGPKLGDVAGIYAYEIHDEGSEICQEYDRATAAFKERFNSPFHSYEQSAPNGKCLSYRYVGPLYLKNYPYIYVSYFDAPSYKAGYGIFVSEIRNNLFGPVARAIACTANFEVKEIPNCHGTDELFRILMSTNGGKGDAH